MNERSKKAYSHNGLIGSAYMTKAQMKAVQESPTTSQYAKELASKMEHMSQLLINDLKTNRIY